MTPMISTILQILPWQVEILFSPGAAYNPVDTVPIKKDHVLPVMPRVPIHCGGERGGEEFCFRPQPQRGVGRRGCMRACMAG